jgi:D-glycero-alpha-D-manno-heptose-7-phosphate kinase
VSFFGGGSDLPGFYRREGGAVLSMTIDKSVYVTVSRKFDDSIRVSYSRTEEVGSVSEVQHPLAREALKLRGIEGGIEIVSVADVPARGTGLGSSSSFTVGLLNALSAYQGAYAPAVRLAEESCEIEIERCGEPIGKQDQYAAAFGGLNLICFNTDDTVSVRKVICPPETLPALQSRLLFFYTGITRSASELLREQSKQTSNPGAASRGLSNMVEMAAAAYEALCAGRVEAIGPMLHEAWMIKRGLSPGISNTLIDEAYAAALGTGAEGGKLLGAGGGGFLMICAEPELHGAIRETLRSLRETPFAFDPQGSNIIFVH